MPDIKMSEIIVGERFRKKFEDIEGLAASINKHGLIEPIVLDEHNNLIAGERRFKAHVFLKRDTIEAKYIKDLNELEKKEVELEENIQRKAFTWQEEVGAKASLHKLKQKLHGAAIKGHDSKGWGMKDTATALGESTATVSLDIQLARGMKAFPELMKEKNNSTAFKKMRMLQEKILQEELAKRMKKGGMLDRPEVINDSCLSAMAKMDAESFDLIVTDPPYGIDVGKAHTFGRMTMKSTYADGDFETFDLLDKAFAEMYRVLKPNCHTFVFCAVDKTPTVIKLLEKHGFDVHPLPLIWDKGSGSYPSQSTSFVHSYEAFIHCQKGRRKLNGTPRDVFPIKRVPATRKVHPSEKPTELLRDLINLSSFPGERILDPFAGSGSTLVAAKETSRQCLGIELDPKFHAEICKRLEGGDSNGA